MRGDTEEASGAVPSRSASSAAAVFSPGSRGPPGQIAQVAVLEVPPGGVQDAVPRIDARHVAEDAPGLLEGERTVLAEKVGPAPVERRLQVQRPADCLARR